MEMPNWYTTGLLKVLTANDKTKQIVYAVPWRNYDMNHFYVPFKGHEQEEDFIEFAKNPHVFLLNDLNEFNKK